MFHTEKEPEEPLPPTGPVDDYFTYLESHLSTYETNAIADVLSLAHLAPQLAMHIAHLSARRNCWKDQDGLRSDRIEGSREGK